MASAEVEFHELPYDDGQNDLLVAPKKVLFLGGLEKTAAEPKKLSLSETSSHVSLCTYTRFPLGVYLEVNG